MADLDSLQIKIDASSVEATGQIERLTTAMQDLKAELNSGWKNPIKGLNSRIPAGAGGIRGGKDTGGASSVKNAEKVLEKTDEALSKLSEKLLDLQERIEQGTQFEQAFGGPGRYEELEQYKKELEEVSAEIDKLDAKRRALLQGQATVGDGLIGGGAGVSSAASAAAESSKNLYEYLQKASEIGFGNLLSINENVSEITDRVKKLDETKRRLEEKTKINIDAKDVDNAQSKISGLLSSIGRMAKYRAIRSAIKAVTAAFSEGLENAYQYSKAVGGDLAPALDRVATAATQMKNQLGAAFGQLLIQIEPIIEKIIQFVTKMAQALSMFIAMVSGKKEYLVANEVATSWSDATKSVNGYSKAVKSALIGIDELNVIEPPSSGGGGGSGTDYGGLFHYEPVEWPDWSKLVLPLGFGELQTEMEGATVAAAELSTVAGLLPSLLTAVGKASDEAADGVGELQTGLAAKGGLVMSISRVSGQISELKAASPVSMVIVASVAGAVAPISVLQKQLQNLRSQFSDVANGAAEAATSITRSVEDVVKQVQGGQAQVGVALAGAVPSTASVADGFEKMRQRTSVAMAVATGSVSAFSYNTIASLSNWKKNVSDGTSGIVPTVSKAVETSVISSFNNARENISKFASETSEGIGEWGSYVSKIGGAVPFGFATGIYSGLTNAAANIASFENGTASSFHSWANNGLSIIGDWARGVAETVRSALSSAWQSFKSFMEATGQKISGFWKEHVGDIKNGALHIGVISQTPAGLTMPTLPVTPMPMPLPVPAFATGGAVSAGQMFIAREAGPELVGNIGGRTAVMNNDQIVQSVTNGVATANEEQNRLLREQNELLTAILARTGIINIGGKEVTNLVEKTQRERGASIMAGGVFA